MKINEENFIEHIKKKNQKGLDYFVDTYSKLVYKVVHSVIGSGFYIHSVDECVNDVFLSIWNNIECFDNEKGNFKTWTIAISKYRAIDYRRQLIKNNSLEFDENIAEKDVSIKSESDAEHRLLMKEKRAKLLKIINEMNEIDREIFIKRYFFDQNIEDIADELEVKRTVIDNRLSRGRKALKEKINSLEGGTI